MAAEDSSPPQSDVEDSSLPQNKIIELTLLFFGFQHKYTLLQKKRMFHPSIFPVDPGSLTLTQGHKFCHNVRFTDTHSSSKEMQPSRTCVSPGEECMTSATRVCIKRVKSP